MNELFNVHCTCLQPFHFAKIVIAAIVNNAVNATIATI